MTKPTTNNQEQGFIYQLGQDVAKLGAEIEQLKNKTGKALRVSVPAKPDKYSNYELPATVELPKEYQNAICIKTIDGDVSLIKTTNTLTLSTTSIEQVVFIAPIYRLEEDNTQAAFDAERMSLIDESIERQEREERERQEREERERQEREERERQEREERERQEREQRERQEREERERQEREQRERQERDYRENYVYYALVKYALVKYANALEIQDGLNGIKLVPNWLGLDDFLAHPFLRIEDGVVSSKEDYLSNTQNIINDLKAQVSKFEGEKQDIDNGLNPLDLSKLEKPIEYRLALL